MNVSRPVSPDIGWLAAQLERIEMGECTLDDVRREEVGHVQAIQRDILEAGATDAVASIETVEQLVGDCNNALEMHREHERLVAVRIEVERLERLQGDLVQNFQNAQRDIEENRRVVGRQTAQTRSALKEIRDMVVKTKNSKENSKNWQDSMTMSHNVVASQRNANQ